MGERKGSPVHGTPGLLTILSCRLLSRMCDHVMEDGESSAVREVHEYLAARVTLLTCLHVSNAGSASSFRRLLTWCGGLGRGTRRA